VDISETVTVDVVPVREFIIEPTESVSIDRVQNHAAFNKRGDKIAWINSDKNEVFVTDNDGNHLFNFGSTGRGPEEFLEVFSIGFDLEENVVVYDAKLDLFKKFKISHNFIILNNIFVAK
jgi:DNA-binding beta-propeller fold protein YncE